MSDMEMIGIPLSVQLEITQLRKEKQAIVDGMNGMLVSAAGKLERYKVAAAKWYRIEAAIAKDPNLRALPQYILDEYFDETECGP